MWDPVLKTRVERTAGGLDAAKQLLDEFHEAKLRPGRLQAEHVRFADVAARYLIAYRVKRDGSPRPKSSLAKERTCLNVYILRGWATPGSVTWICPTSTRPSEI